MQKPVNRKSLYKKANKIINKICTKFRVFQKIVQVGLQVVKFKIWGWPIFCAGIIKKWVIFQDSLPKDTQKCWYQWVGFESEKILKATKLLCLMRKTRINLNTLRWVRYKLGKLTRSYNKYIMLSHPPGNLQTLITNALIDDRYREAIQLGLHKYQIKQFKIDLLCPQEVFAMHYVLSTKFYSSSQQSNDTWWENELRLFIWALVCYSYLQHRCVSQMNSTDWLFFSEIFNHRSPDIFEFQALSILKRETKFSKWTSEQIKLLDSIIKSKNVKNKWSDIAKNLFLLSQKKYFRTSKQCREYWINHLDPTPLKSEWNLQEDLELLKAIKVLGKRWSKVSKKLRGRRTQHMVKNRYKSLFQFQQKRLVGQSNKTLSEDQIMSVLEKRLRSAIQEQKIKSYQQKQELSKTKGSAADKFQSAEDQKLGDPIEELLMESVNQMHGVATDSGKLPLEYDTIQSMGCHVESPFQIQFSMNRSQMAEDQDFGSFFHKEYYFNL